MDKQLVLHFMIINMLEFFLNFHPLYVRIRRSNFGAFVSNFYGAFLRFKFGGFSRLWFNYFSFSLILKGFNNGQVYIET